MKKISIITDDLKKKILEFLYHDEMYNAILIELIQNNTDNLGELYVNETKEGITDILHIKNDGNSDFTNFLYTSENGLRDIACKIKELNYKKILLAGKLEDVNCLLKILGYGKSTTPNLFYKLDIEKYKNVHMQYQGKIRLASLNSEDLERVKYFTFRFLEAETEEEIEAVTDTEKILAKMKAGVYILDYKNNAIGMARFIGETNNFAEITSVYIDKAYRGKGFGKELIGHMIEIAIQEQKTPILVTSVSNVAAMKTYESMGFERQGEYAYEFLD
ncbi:GNAT family N-acetyltransferase [Proteiniborus sp. MB09-C3]|uniref:GNAT family N-acetyltransferase n=1 Tax=Proteiniborus sp. MB09-C3 TaxID=3050072 RepID=UPI002557801D|nr:GNAT family N-acetyltransferase [Proteiniborus sp. MB09-C3]WIV12736.1 GNAT family N-acetyltransferase [Proteiniborus sp. MB09-C3]